MLYSNKMDNMPIIIQKLKIAEPFFADSLIQLNSENDRYIRK